MMPMETWGRALWDSVWGCGDPRGVVVLCDVGLCRVAALHGAAIVQGVCKGAHGAAAVLAGLQGGV